MPLIVENKLQLLDIIHRGLELGASDIDISPGKPVMFRVDGEMHPASKFGGVDGRIIKEEDTYALLDDYLNSDVRSRYETRKSYDISLGLSSTRVRLHFYETLKGICVSCRVIPLEPRRMEELLIPPVVENWTRQKGLAIVSGLMNTGKTTTLAAIVDHINNTRAEKIVILEDPVEYLHTDKKGFIFQREIGLNSPSYTDALRDILRENADTVVVGEIRHMQAMDAVFAMAEAGLKVFTSLHADSAVETIERIVNLFPPSDYNRIYKRLSWTLTGVLTQRLILKRKGGRILTCEILTNTDAVRNLIREGKIQQVSSYLDSGTDEMCSFEKYTSMLKTKWFIQ